MIKITITDYTKMSIEQLQTERTKKGNKLLKTLNDSRYTKENIKYEKNLFDTLGRMINNKYKITYNIKGIRKEM